MVSGKVVLAAESGRQSRMRTVPQSQVYWWWCVLQPGVKRSVCRPWTVWTGLITACCSSFRFPRTLSLHGQESTTASS